MCIYLTDVNDENRFQNRVHESEKALLVPVLTKGSSADHESRNWIEQHSKQDSYLIQQFYSQLLIYNQPANGEERGETGVRQTQTADLQTGR